MKKIFKYFGVFAALMGALTACNVEEFEPTDVGLGIKVFFPTKVVTGQPMTINGSGLSDVREIVFPDGIKVTDFELVGTDMIRVNAPAGISAEGGKIIVRSSEDEAESRLPLSLGNTVISGYSKQEGESIKGGEQITIYGNDLEFINGVELLDSEGNPALISDEEFYRKGTSSVIINVPKKVFEGTFAGKVHTIDGKEFLMPELAYEPANEGGHWGKKKVVFWENDGSKGEVSWGGDYRFGLDGHDGNNECLATFKQDVWDIVKSGTFYMLAKGSDWVQMRITTGWWSTTWTGDDIMTGNERIIDNGDGTYYIEINFEGDPILDLLDDQHLLLTGSGYTPLQLYYEADVWEGGEEGHWETVKTSLWKNDGSKGAVSWSGDYRFAGEGHGTGEEIYTFPKDVWDKLKSTDFYLLLEGEDPQVRVTTGWWTGSWCDKDFQPGNDERLVDNGNGTWTLKVNLSDASFLDLMDEQHLLFTGDRYTPLEIFFQEEVWVAGGGDTLKEVVFWENDGSAGEVNWNGVYRFGLDGNDSNNECIATFPQEIWDVIKTGTFYLQAKGSDWPQIRVTTGWWTVQWLGKDNDIMPSNMGERMVDNEDGTFYIEIKFDGDPIVEQLDIEHLLFTGSGYTPLKLYYMK